MYNVFDPVEELTIEYNIWKKKKDLENVKVLVVEFERSMSVEVRRQERLNKTEKRDFQREELLEKYIARILYKQDNRKFKIEYLRKLERNWQR